MEETQETQETHEGAKGAESTAGAAINPNQAQGLTVALRMLERILFSLEDLYCDNGETKEGIMLSLANPLSHEQRLRLEQMTEQAREITRVLSERFGLKHETADLPREIHGRLAEMWAALEDARSHKLRSYGPVDARLAALLDPGIEELIEIVLAMDDEIFHPRHEPAGVEVGGSIAGGTEKPEAKEIESNHDGRP